MATRRNSETDTASAILDVAERLVQTRGFNGFSYADVASELGVTKPALHYHFLSKTELGQALLARYTDRFSQALETIDASGTDASRKLAAYADLYAQVLAEDRMCLCGMLAADYHTLSEPMRQAVVRFFDINQNWLAGVIDQGRTDESLQVDGASQDVAQMIIGTLEGGMLVARTYRDPNRFATSTKRLLAEIATPRPEPDPNRADSRSATRGSGEGR
jgi:TetR/AcrR family transcriptional repressor of nem operon